MKIITSKEAKNILNDIVILDWMDNPKIAIMCTYNQFLQFKDQIDGFIYKQYLKGSSISYLKRLTVSNVDIDTKTVALNIRKWREDIGRNAKNMDKGFGILYIFEDRLELLT